MAGICHPVDQQRPIDVAARRKLLASQGARGDDAGLVGVKSAKSFAQLRLLREGPLTGCGEISPPDAELVFELFYFGGHLPGELKNKKPLLWRMGHSEPTLRGRLRSLVERLVLPRVQAAGARFEL